jgi:hypothetical protein
LGKRRHLRKIARLDEVIQAHRGKIASEQGKDHPDEGLIAHWEREIRAFENRIRQARKRLGMT